jgi:PKD repeat protein
MRTLLSMLFCVFVGAQNLNAQFVCGANQKLQQLYQNDPQLMRDHEALLRSNYRIEEKDNDTMVIFTIPIVFHVIHYNGSENITDDQIYDQIAILNRDYRLLNEDTALVIDDFKSIYADVGIEFKLAKLDPYGNCTNGIEHIYSHETFQGDDYSKLNQWYRSNYLNVWIVDQMENGVAGYAYYPTAVDGSGFWRDGIIILHNYIGSIGTSNPTNSRALTHEIGHYLGLSHPWGSTNEPGVACGNDGIPDTPVTRGSNLNCDLSLSQCTVGVIENVQNYMDYSYCSVMFTQNQATAMRNILQGISGNRNQLINDTTAFVTGIYMDNLPECIPIPYAFPSRTIVCPGEAVTFYDRSFNGTTTIREWSFFDGQTTSATAANPTVTYSTPGYKSVILRVGNGQGMDSIVLSNVVYVATEWPDFVGPATIDFEVQTPFIVENPEQNWAKFEVLAGVGYNQSKALKLSNYFNIAGTTPFSPNSFYNNRLGGSQDAFITPSFDLVTTSSVQVTFDYAYATNAENEADITESLQVLSSRNCGLSWTPRLTITGAELLTAGNYGYNAFTPTTQVVWKSASFNYTPNGQDTDTRFKFLFTASDFSNNLYIDNIRVNGALQLTEQNLNQIQVYPNPLDLESGQMLTIEYISLISEIQFYDQLGKIIPIRFDAQKEGEKYQLQIPNELAPGIYYLKVNSTQGPITTPIFIKN